MGLIGRNGAGKSTLLKVLARITDPTHGEVRLWGRVGSLLEVGTGFHPELTGRENVYLNGAILGMNRKEISSKFDAIVDFAGVEKFLDTPVKRFSSGMYVRLAFAVAAHLDSEILLLDEVLAVGDADFQEKCLGKVSELARSGRAVILVSHNMATVQEFSTTALLLDAGTVIAAGPTREVVDAYIQAGGSISSQVDVGRFPRFDAALGTQVRIEHVSMTNDSGLLASGEGLGYDLSVRVIEPVGSLRVAHTVFREDRSAVGTTFSDELVNADVPGTLTVRVEMPDPGFAPGRYYLAVSIGKGDNFSTPIELDGVMDSIHFEVAAPSRAERVSRWDAHWGPIRLPRLGILSERSATR
jgi:lipopolysaccharide transport system ATP-binding protein